VRVVRPVTTRLAIGVGALAAREDSPGETVEERDDSSASARVSYSAVRPQAERSTDGWFLTQAEDDGRRTADPPGLQASYLTA
jgi:hypothetical protein